MQSWLRVCSICLAIALLFTPVAFAEDFGALSTQQGFAKDEVLIKFKNKNSIQAKSILNSSTSKLVSTNAQLDVNLVKLSGISVEDMIRKYKNNPSVEYIEPNYYAHITMVPNDPFFESKQWGPQKIKVPEAWDVTQGSASTKIAIVDTGVDDKHPDLAGKVVNGYDFVDNDKVANDGNGHGTHCAGIAAASTNNNIGIAGVAPNATILAVRVLNSQGSGSYDQVAKGITFAADNGAQVISLSLGGSGGSETLKKAVDYAWGKGAVIVAAAGNSGSTSPIYPAYYDKVISVASTTKDDVKSSFSTYGKWVSVAAPGSDIYSAYKGDYKSLNGTSMAAPHVAGLAGLLSSQNKDNVKIREAIEKSADKINGTGNSWKFGRVNALNALKY